MMTMRNYFLNPPTCYEEVIERWRKHALHILENERAYSDSLVELSKRFLAQHS